MLPLGNFSGQHRRKPQQNFSTVVLSEKDDLLSHLNESRDSRENERRRLNASYCIQKHIRRFLARLEYRRRLIAKIDSFKEIKEENLKNIVALCYYLQSAVLKCPRFDLICQSFVRHRRLLLDDELCYRQLTSICICILSHYRKNTSQMKNLVLRLLECFVSERNALEMLESGYLRVLNQFAVDQLPASLEFVSYDDDANAPRHIFGENILNLMLKTVSAAASNERIVAMLFVREVCSSNDSVTLRYVLPSLASSPDFIRLILSGLAASDWTGGFSEVDCYSNLLLFMRHSTPIKDADVASNYLSVFSQILHRLPRSRPLTREDSTRFHQVAESDEDEEMDVVTDNSEDVAAYLSDEQSELLKAVLERQLASCLRLANQQHSTWTQVTQVLYSLSLNHNYVLSNVPLILSQFVFNVDYLRWLWQQACEEQQPLLSGKHASTLNRLQAGELVDVDKTIVVSHMSIFAQFLYLFLLPIHDKEFHLTPPAAFNLPTLCNILEQLIKLSLGILSLIYPRHLTNHVSRIREMKKNFVDLFRHITTLVSSLYARDCRLRFFSTSINDARWQINDDLSYNVSHDKVANILANPPTNAFDVGIGLFLISEIRFYLQLTFMPFSLPFEPRYRIFSRLLQILTGLKKNSGEYDHRSRMDPIIRRAALYDDAFRSLRASNALTLNKRITIHFVNPYGLEEAGIDGGGMWNDFLAEFVKEAFNPSRGLFLLTHTEQQLYPNPASVRIYSNFEQHYHFIGQMLARIIADEILVELRLAPFFLIKMINPALCDIHHLATLDPELYANLLALQNYNGDATDLGLDFTIVDDVFGETKVVELCSDGSKLAVNNSNKLLYIYLVCDYKLNKQIRRQCDAFRAGLTSILPSQVLNLFTSAELQNLIAGVDERIDVADFKENTIYHSSFSVDHEVIKHFWTIMNEDFGDEERKLLLKFSTGCSRPPMFGFSELNPKFGISPSEDDRLPSASTCFNLLKLPMIHDRSLLKERLLYSIRSDAGFELS